jgi:hypothetical protein
MSVIVSSYRAIEPIQKTGDKPTCCKVHHMQVITFRGEDLFVCIDCGFTCPVRGIAITGYNIPKEEP